MTGSVMVCAALAVLAAALTVKIFYMKKSAEEIRGQFAQKLESDTNTPITVSSGDKTMRALANDINVQLLELRRQKHRFVKGDTELKNAVTGISHDLRTPLTAINSYLELLDKAEKSETVERYVDVIKNRTEILIGLTEELFRYSVITSPEYDAPMENADVKAVLEESILGFYAALQERGITPDIRMPEQKVVRRFNPAALSRVFSNILSNVVKYSDGDLSVEMTDAGEIIFSNMASGYSEVEAERLFDRFYTLENARRSTGLGLSIARILLEQMNGEIHARYKDEILSISVKLSVEGD